MKKRKFRAKKARICLNPFSPLFGVKIKQYMTAADIVAANTSCLNEFFREDLANDTEFTRYELFENVTINCIEGNWMRGVPLRCPFLLYQKK